MSDDLERLRQRKLRQRSTQPAGNFGPSGRKQVTINRVLARVDAAQELREIEAGTRTPTPERITMALNIMDLYGPEVDRALGGEEPMVDEWESGTRTPTVAQMHTLASLTGFHVRFFYWPPPLPLTGGWMCGEDGCRPLGAEDDQA